MGEGVREKGSEGVMGDLADEWNLQVLQNRINEDGRKGICAIVFLGG